MTDFRTRKKDKQRFPVSSGKEYRKSDDYEEIESYKIRKIKSTTKLKEQLKRQNEIEQKSLDRKQRYRKQIEELESKIREEEQRGYKSAGMSGNLTRAKELNAEEVGVIRQETADFGSLVVKVKGKWYIPIYDIDTHEADLKPIKRIWH